MHAARAGIASLALYILYPILYLQSSARVAPAPSSRYGVVRGALARLVFQELAGVDRSRARALGSAEGIGAEIGVEREACCGGRLQVWAGHHTRVPGAPGARDRPAVVAARRPAGYPASAVGKGEGGIWLGDSCSGAGRWRWRKSQALRRLQRRSMSNRARRRRRRRLALATQA